MTKDKELNVDSDEEIQKDWRDFETRNRTACLETLVEGDIIVTEEEIYRVDSGEINIYSDGSLDKLNGEIVEVDLTAVHHAESIGKTVFYLN